MQNGNELHTDGDDSHLQARFFVMYLLKYLLIIYVKLLFILFSNIFITTFCNVHRCLLFLIFCANDK